MKSYNQSLAKNDSYKPYTDIEIKEMKDTEVINPLRFKRLLATIDELTKPKKEGIKQSDIFRYIQR